MKISIKQISGMTGFSPATVSNALNRKRGVNKLTAERILKIARENGYYSESKISAIRLVIYKNQGQVVSDTPFFSSLIEGVERECRSCGYDTVITNLNRSGADYEQRLEQVLNDSDCGILLLGTELAEGDAAAFEKAVSPLVVLDSWFDSMNFDAVLISNTDSVCGAVEYLIGKGHQQIGYLKSSLRIQNFSCREAGYRRALARAGLSPKAEHTFSLTPTMEGAFEDMDSLLCQCGELPTAFFADNDMIALGAMKALKKHGQRIPEDVSLIGFDDLPYGMISCPALTTIRVFKQEMGQIAVRRLNELIKNGSRVKTKIQICNEFIERESVRKL